MLVKINDKKYIDPTAVVAIGVDSDGEIRICFAGDTTTYISVDAIRESGKTTDVYVEDLVRKINNLNRKKKTRSTEADTEEEDKIEALMSTSIPKTINMSFSEALVKLRQGTNVTRASWGNDSIFLQYQPSNVRGYGAYIKKHGLTKLIDVGWKPESDDMFADDWKVVPLTW